MHKDYEDKKVVACTINDTSMVKMFAHLNCLYIHCTIKLYHHIIINLLYIHIIHVQSICEGINYKILSIIFLYYIDRVMLKDENCHYVYAHIYAYN